MPSALTPLANITLGSTATTVTFSSIVGTYRDLRLVIQGRGTSTPIVYVRFNSDSGSNYANVWLTGWPTSGIYPGQNSGVAHILGNFNLAMGTTKPSIVALDVMDYQATDKQKTTLSKYGGTDDSGFGVEMLSGRWANTAAITTLSVTASTGSFAIGTTMALYGVSA
jgi:hypothetical protein